MLQREKFQTSYTVTIYSEEEKILKKYWVFTNYNDDRDITYYNVEVSEMHERCNYEKIYRFRGIKDLEYAKEIAENYKKFKITKKNENKFYTANEMR